MNNAGQDAYEQPSLSVIEKLSPQDPGFKTKFILALKEEFAKHFVAYQYHIELNEPRAAAEIVNKLKATIGYLDMTKSLVLIERHEEKLRTGNSTLDPRFKKILFAIKRFLSDY